MQYVTQKVQNTQHGKRNRSLEADFRVFIENYTEHGNILLASPGDITSFLADRDTCGKTTVHIVDCPSIMDRDPECSCPKRLAFGTLLNIISLLHGLFDKIGLQGQWNPVTSSGNPVMSPEVMLYKKGIKKEQSQGHVLIKQAKLLFLDKLSMIIDHINNVLVGPLLSRKRFIALRDKAFFLMQFFSGDRAGDLGHMLAQEIKALPDDSGIVVTHTDGKNLSVGRTNVYSIPKCPESSLCVISALDKYSSGCEKMGVSLKYGYLFRPVTESGMVLDQPLSYNAVYDRLKYYLQFLNVYDGETPHSLRGACAMMMAAQGGPDLAPEVMKHIGWFDQKSLSLYSRNVQLKNNVISKMLSTMIKNQNAECEPLSELRTTVNADTLNKFFK